jgi:hypothetical protein
MNEGRPVDATLPPVLPYHYQLLCAMALATIFLVQLQQGAFLWGAAVVLLGALAIVQRAPISPIAVLFPLVGGQLYLQYLFPSGRPRNLLQVEDVVMCTATLAYIGGHYRLISLWRSVLPADPRQRYHPEGPVIMGLNKVGKVALQHRPALLLSRGELALFVLQLPMFALLAQVTWLVLGTPRELHGLSARWIQFMLLVWGLALSVFIVGQLFRLIRLLRMDRITAKMVLQDTLWRETRREQRRVARWLVWWKVKARPDENPMQT